MATVTEPPWLNKIAGTAARNGTTSHTITFGFTATAGSKLVLIIGGAVTNTIASGWTERQQPVSSAELSLFERDAAGGETSVTITHNGSNYPCGYCLYELPPGTTYTGSNASTPSNDTWPAYSGLPGTAQMIIAARCRSMSSGGGSAASTWSAPWVEDCDQAAAASPTDGIYVTVAHALNITATSITPASTPTYGAGSFSSDREIITAAYNVAALSDPPNEATATGAITWGPATGVAKRTPKAAGNGGMAWGPGTAVAERSPVATAAGAIGWAGSAVGRREPKASAAGGFSFVGSAVAARESITTAAGSFVFGPGSAISARVSRATADGAITWTGSALSQTVRKASAVGGITYSGSAVAARDSQTEAAGSITWGPGVAVASQGQSAAAAGAIEWGPGVAVALADHIVTAAGLITWGPGTAAADSNHDTEAAGAILWGPGTAVAAADREATAGGTITWGPGTAVGQHPADEGRDITILGTGGPTVAVTISTPTGNPIIVAPVTAALSAGLAELPIVVGSPADDGFPECGSPTVAVAVLPPTAAVTYTPPTR